MTGRIVQQIPVDTPSKSYEVLVGRDLLPQLGSLVAQALSPGAVCVVADASVAALHAQTAMDSLEAAGYAPTLVTFAAGEENKTLSTLGNILEQVAEASLTRDDAVVCLGGGVTGDMGGLTAALYLRGIDLVQVPTSLLSMVDSSVGGKTAVDLDHGKNLVGAFYQPSLVVVDVELLRTMPAELFRDGCGEVIKHGMIADEELFTLLAEQPLSQEAYDYDQLARIVARNICIKRDVVVQDEREGGLRQILNFGHTIGHAVEAASHFTLGHGACVCIGMCAMTRAAAALGWCEAGVAQRLEACVTAFGLPVDAPTPHEDVLAYMEHDKKRHADSFNIVVPLRVGAVKIRRVSRDQMKEILSLGLGVCA